MNHPQYISQPVNPYFIVFSFIAAFLLNLLPWGKLVGVPDFVALVLLFWNVHQPRKVSMGISFISGLLIDVHNASLLGEHALAYTLLSYGAITIHRCMLQVSLSLQIFAVMPLLITAQIVPCIIHLLDPKFFSWNYLINGFVEATLWPLISFLLLMPQHRSSIYPR